MKKHILLETIVILMILLFAYTAASKLLYYDDFYRSLLRAPLKAYTRLVSIAIPIMELIVVFALLFPRSRKWGLYGSFTLMSVFTLYVAYILLFSRHIPCTCGGIIQQMSWRQHLTFNSLFMLLSFIGIQLNKKSKQEIITKFKTTLF